MSKLRKFVHVRLDGNQVFFKGEYLDCDETDTVKVCTTDELVIGVISIRPGESVGEYFVEEKNN